MLHPERHYLVNRNECIRKLWDGCGFTAAIYLFVLVARTTSRQLYRILIAFKLIGLQIDDPVCLNARFCVEPALHLLIVTQR